MTYEFLTPGQCIDKYNVVYHDAELDARGKRYKKAEKYLVLHEVWSRNKNNYQEESGQWNQYKGVITWNKLIYEKYKDRYNMVYCDQFMNMAVERVNNYIPFSNRNNDLCVIYGNPASQDSQIMMARYDLPLALKNLGLSVSAYGLIPDRSRKEYRPEWQSIFKGSLPPHSKKDALGITKFSICFENSRDPFYAYDWITEKIYDCLGCGCIPIYWGAPNIKDVVPEDLFIDWRDFQDANDLYSYLIDTPRYIFRRMSEEGPKFIDTIDFCRFQEVFDNLK